ncbi:related to RRP12 - Protein required for normal pre-rRNA Processing [Melanopsichium pennsylvanicum]|uniref:Related to RRP12 - Protein required for normal pre-rRNA Processing n=2 Tax=Melanopsichium pennsylvanicum TaxID=63383 RepID=A0AAJ5C789_9BASI|nr:related to RRP12-Protein required for normal pre-rRNA Processing [Melanopsichium pennsylvanicum 4]SNX86308.1 related to RRP12 - Protein required for normal pre-rRNA Processing [Melanopsichium pennsylvanicum]
MASLDMDASAAAASLDSLHSALSKIRHHTNSKLENQKGPAQLLVAVEATLGEQDANASTFDSGASASKHALVQRAPAEYFLALESMLELATSPSSPPQLLNNVFYLLSIVAPHVSAGIIRAKLSSIVPSVGKLLSTPHPTTFNVNDTSAADNYASALKSALAILQAIYTAFESDVSTLEKDGPLRLCWSATLNLCADSRPKVRRRAQLLITSILPTTATATVKPYHPYLKLTFDWIISTLDHVADAGSVSTTSNKNGKKKKNNNNNNNKQDPMHPKYDKKSGIAKQAQAAAALRQNQGDTASVGIWTCGFAKQMINILPIAQVDHLVAALLRLPGIQNPFLTVAAFDVFEAFLKTCRPSVSSGITQADALLIQSHVSSTPISIGQDTLSSLVESLRSPAFVPSTADVQLLPAYLRALEHAMSAYSRFDSGKPAWRMAPQVWADVLAMSMSAKSDASRTAPAVRSAGRDTLIALLKYCVPDAAVNDSIKASFSNKKKAAVAPLLDMIQSIEDALGKDSLQYMHSRAEILSVLASLIARLRYHYVPNTQPTHPAAASLTMHIVQSIAELRQEPTFEHREHADTVIGAAVEVCGPRLLLDAMPLNLFGEAEGPGRAWLLPLIRTKINNTELSHFTGDLVSLSEKIFNKRQEAETDSRPVEAKMYEALTEQIWALFPAYCAMPRDLIAAFTRQFAELLTNVLYTQPNLRPSICRGLQALVYRNEALVSSGAPRDSLKHAFGLDQADGEANIAHLSAIAPNLLAVLFNVFSQSPGEGRGFVYDTIAAYLRVMSPQDIQNTYVKVKTTLEQSLSTLSTKQKKNQQKESIKTPPPVPYTMLDLLSALIPHLDKSAEGSAADLFSLICQDNVLRSHDSTVQKKSYRILSRLLEGDAGKQILLVGGKGANRVTALLDKLRESTASVALGAKRDRVLLLATLVPNIPSDELHHLPTIIPEAVLATKEVNAVTRQNAYELLVQMGYKMEQGGVINRSLVEGHNAAGAEQEEQDDNEMADGGVVSASISEYLTMVAAGLAGTTPHMISATITALSRLVYEFKENLEQPVLDELLSTIEVYLQSANREIVKSAIGFVKVAIVDFNTALIDSHLPKLIPALLGWSTEHKQHFKVKVRHIFERLLRRFGFERIYQLTDEDNRKLINNIRKRKERAKRKRADAAAERDAGVLGEDDDEPGLAPRILKTKGGNDAFEEVVYGSESDISDSDEDGDGDAEVDARGGGTAAALARNRDRKNGRGKDDEEKGGRRRRAKQQDEAYIEMDDDDDVPMDLLDRSATTRISLTNPNAKNAANGRNKKRQPGQEASKFALDEATGRMLIDDDEDHSSKANAASKRVSFAEGADSEAIDVEGAGTAYMNQARGVDGMAQVRGGAVKFNKNNKRTREAEREMELEQMAIEEAQDKARQVQGGRAQQGKEKKRRVKQTIGQEFRAKRGGGDVIRNGKSPYAYVPLSEVAGKKAGKNDSVSYTGKGDKSGKRR